MSQSQRLLTYSCDDIVPEKSRQTFLSDSRVRMHYSYTLLTLHVSKACMHAFRASQQRRTDAWAHCIVSASNVSLWNISETVPLVVTQDINISFPPPLLCNNSVLWSMTLTKCIQQLSHDNDDILLCTKSIGPNIKAATLHISTDISYKPQLQAFEPHACAGCYFTLSACAMSLPAQALLWILATGTKIGCECCTLFSQKP